MPNRKNCWEFMNCGREPGGVKVDELKVCPAATDSRFEGVHGGKNAGRACWVAAGQLCELSKRGTSAKKDEACLDCTFYNLVKREESPNFTPVAVLLQQMMRS